MGEKKSKSKKTAKKAAEQGNKPQFIHLRVHSSYSLSKGAIKLEDLAELTVKNKMPAVALTDNSNLFGSLEFAKECGGSGVQPIIGCVVNIASELKQNGEKQLTGKLILLAKNETGYRNLLKLVSNSYLEGENSQNPIITFAEFEGKSEGLVALTGGPDGLVGHYLQNGNIKEAEKILLELKKLFSGNLYVELMRHGMEAENITEKQFIDLAYEHDLPLVATNDVYFASRDMFEAHDALICIAEGRYVNEANRPRFTAEHYFKSAAEMSELFADIPEAVMNTITIAKRCAVMPEASEPMLPSFPTANGRSEEEELLFVAENGLKERLENYVFTEDMDAAAKEETAKSYFDRLKYELDVITGMKFSGYFLIVSDFIRWSKENGVPVGPGRGSGAGSVVAWALSITNLDPLRFGLLFERFLNPERVSMPDFDIDFCQENRDRVIHYVQERYGADKVAQIITFGKLQARAVLRDVGRVLQIPYGQVDKICKMIPWNPLAPVTLSQAIEMDPQLKKEAKQDEAVAKLLDIGLKLEGLHRHASTHAAGVVIASKPLTDIIPLYSDHRSDIPTTQYSMKYAEMAGLVKFDFLGLKTLTVIDRALRLLKKQGMEVDIEHIPLDDKKTFDMLSEGSATGVFQMESSGMRDALRKMKPDNIEDIIALISLYRPGPMENIPTYIARKHGKEKPDYLHPLLEECLKETFGVIIYQEQVMQIARILAGYSLGSADLLRRAMGKKIKSEMDAQRDMFVQGAIKNGVSKSQASSIFDLVAKFAGYGFNKSHAAAYAVIGYQTAYLKANYPVEFLTASMNIDIGDTDKLNIFREEAVKSGIEVLPPDINKSSAQFSVEERSGKKAIRYGLGALKNVGLAAMLEMEKERDENGKFSDIFDFVRRCGNKVINKRQLESLAKSGSFDCLNKNRRQIFENSTILTRYSQSAADERESSQTNLFGEESNVVSVGIISDVEDWFPDARMNQEFDAIGFYLSAHPLDDYREDLERVGVVFSSEINEKVKDKGGVILVAGMVTKITHRATAKRRFSYLYVSDPTGSMEISLFDERLINESRDVIESKKPIIIKVDARRDEGGVRLQAESIKPLDEYLAARKFNVRILLEDTNHLPEIKNILGEKNKGQAKVRFLVRTENNMEVIIALPEGYMLNNKALSKIAKVSGVADVAAD